MSASRPTVLKSSSSSVVYRQFRVSTTQLIDILKFKIDFFILDGLSLYRPSRVGTSLCCPRSSSSASSRSGSSCCRCGGSSSASSRSGCHRSRSLTQSGVTSGPEPVVSFGVVMAAFTLAQLLVFGSYSSTSSSSDTNRVLRVSTSSISFFFLLKSILLLYQEAHLRVLLAQLHSVTQ